MSTIATALGSTYVNDFIDNGRVKKVYAQADAPYRMMPDDINTWYVRNQAGGMVPFSSFSSARWIQGSPRLERYNGLPSMEILGEAAPGKSTGDAMILMEQLASKLPTGNTCGSGAGHAVNSMLATTRTASRTDHFLKNIVSSW